MTLAPGPPAGIGDPAPPAASRRELWARYRKNRLAVVALLVVVAIIILAILADQVAPGRVDLLGRLDRDEVGKLFAGASVVVCPSRVQENQPMTLIEAMAAGVPMVGTDLGGTSELVREGVDGALAPAEDPAALGAAISRVLADPDGWRHLGMASRRRFEEDFAPDTHRERLTAAYSEARSTARQEGR